MTSTTIHVGDMHCASCSSKIRAALESSGSVEQLMINPVLRQLFIQHSEQISPAQLMQNIEALGFTPSLDASGGKEAEDEHLLRRLGVAGICAMQVMMIQIALYAGFFQGMSDAFVRLLSFTALVFCIPVIAYSAVPFFVRGFAFIRQRPLTITAINMDTPIALAVAIAFGASFYATLTGQGEIYFDSVGMFTFLMLGARYLDQRFRHQLAVSDQLTSQLPSTAMRLNADQELEEVALNDLRVGDELWIPQGSQIPVDGELKDEQAKINTALLTGESEAVVRKSGELLFAGTFNDGPGFRMRTAQLADNSRISHIDALADEASFAKHKVSRLADQVARVFIPGILLIALATYLGWQFVDPEKALLATLAVLVVSCPCALSLATPAAISAALTSLRRRGILIRNSSAIEQCANVEDVYFDKTGTLTLPTPKVARVESYPKGRLSDSESDALLKIAATLQRHSSHPLAEAFKPFAVKDMDANNVELLGNQGLQGTVAGQRITIGTAELCDAAAWAIQPTEKAVYMAVDGKPAAVFILESSVRTDAAATIEELAALELGVHIISGDQASHCQALADQLHLGYSDSMTPERKQQEIANKRVMFIGDGLNDLPALASASVSIATMETVDLVKSKADGILMTSKLTALVELVRISRKAKSIMRENLLWALAYNLIAIPLAVAGLATPWMAALGMSASSLIVMANASRLLPSKEIG